MSRYIDADAFLENNKEFADREIEHPRYQETLRELIDEAPSIDIVRCKECKHGEYREEFDDYECHSSGCGLVYDADFYCADGEREGE